MWNPFRRRHTEQRAIDSVPWDVGGPTRQSVTEQRALGLAAVYAANRHLADLISTLPLHAYRRAGDQRQKINTLPVLLHDLEDSGQLGPWLYELVTSLGLHGNAVGAITRFDEMGFPAMVVWLPMTEITVDDSNVLRPVWYWKGRRVEASELIHIPWFKMPGRTLGLSPIQSYALTILNGLSAQEFGKSWFDSGGFPPGTFRNSEKTVTQDESNAIRARLVATLRSGQPLVYGADWAYTPISVPPEQAQFVETMKLTANQIAAIYGIAPDEIGGEAANSLTYSNEEHRQTRRVADSRPWLVRIENALSAVLPERQYVRFGVDAVIRADIKTRHEVYEISRRIQIRTINELRALEELPPVAGGDALVTPVQPPTPAVGRNGHSPEWSLIP